MENINISLNEGSRDKEVSEVRVDGVIDTLTAGELEEVIDSLVNRDRYKIVVDLAGVEYISSAGWGILISHIKDVRAHEGDIKLANLVPDVYEIFELLEFDNVLETFDSLDGAFAAFGAKRRSSSKKKGQTVARLEVVKAKSSSADDHPEKNSNLFVGPGGLSSNNITSSLRSIVQEHPFDSITDIRIRLNRQESGQHLSWWQVANLLRRQHLLTRRSRFRLAWLHGW